MKNLINRQSAKLVMAFVLLFANLSAAVESIYWSNEGSGEIRSGSLNGLSSASTLVSGEGSPCGIAIDSAAGKVYWANFGTNTVRVANLDGTGVKILYSEAGSLCGVAIDPAANLIYWTDFSTEEIRIGSLDGLSPAATLYTEPLGSAPSGLTIDTAAKKIYWTNQFSDEVRVANLDGSGEASTLYSNEDNPLGIAIDELAGLLYWTSLSSGLVRVGWADGTGAQTLFSSENSPGGVAIDPDDNKIYWTIFSGEIRFGNLDGTGAQTLYRGESLSLFAALLKAPVAATNPTISGFRNIGSILSCTQGDWATDMLGAFLYRAPSSFSYTWQRNGVDVPGATNNTFMPTRTGRYTCTVSAHNQAGSRDQVSNRVNVKCQLGEPGCN